MVRRQLAESWYLLLLFSDSLKKRTYYGPHLSAPKGIRQIVTFGLACEEKRLFNAYFCDFATGKWLNTRKVCQEV